MDRTEALTVDVRQLRAVLDGLLRRYEATYGATIPIDRDHYWLIELGAAFSEDLHEPGSKEHDLGVGQISDDIESIAQTAKDLADPESDVSLWHDLQHAVGLLQALAWIDLSPEAG